MGTRGRGITGSALKKYRQAKDDAERKVIAKKLEDTLNQPWAKEKSSVFQHTSFGLQKNLLKRFPLRNIQIIMRCRISICSKGSLK